MKGLAWLRVLLMFAIPSDPLLLAPLIGVVKNDREGLGYVTMLNFIRLGWCLEDGFFKIVVLFIAWTGWNWSSADI